MTDISAHTYGVWIVEEEDGQIAANTPGGLTYTNLVEGDSYIYLDNIVKFERTLSSNREGTEFLGWDTIQVGTREVGASVEGGMRCFVKVTALITEAIGQKLETLFAKHIVRGDGNKYLVRQRAATTFQQFVNESAVLKNYVEIIIRAIEMAETNDAGKDNKLCSITCEQVSERYI